MLWGPGTSARDQQLYADLFDLRPSSPVRLDPKDNPSGFAASWVFYVRGMAVRLAGICPATSRPLSLKSRRRMGGRHLGRFAAVNTYERRLRNAGPGNARCRMPHEAALPRLEGELPLAGW